MWSGPGPGIPEQMRGFVFTASSAGALGPPCPSTLTCGSTGIFLLEADDGTQERGAVTCLDVTGAEAFMSVGIVRGDLVDFFAVYAHDRFLRQSPERDRVAMLPVAGPSCADPDLQADLRQAAAVIVGDVTVVAPCETFVCTQPRSR